MPYSLLVKALPYIATTLVVFLLGSFFYKSGYKNGANSVQVKWDKVEKIRTASIEEAEVKNAIALQKQVQANKVISNELANVKIKHEKAIAVVRSDYVVRLRSSEARSEVYKRQADGGANECRNLANYTARLDRTLEEGRDLVRELTETLRLRDAQLNLVGNSIKATEAALKED